MQRAAKAANAPTATKKPPRPPAKPAAPPAASGTAAPSNSKAAAAPAPPVRAAPPATSLTMSQLPREVRYGAEALASIAKVQTFQSQAAHVAAAQSAAAAAAQLAAKRQQVGLEALVTLARAMHSTSVQVRRIDDSACNDANGASIAQIAATMSRFSTAQDFTD